MRRIAILIACLFAGCAAALPARAVDVPADLVVARLVSESGSVAPGSVVWTDIHLDIKPGWHVYWRNPGDAGIATEIDWHLPPGFSAGGIEWPVPKWFVVGDLANYGYDKRVDLLVPIKTPSSLSGTAALAAHVSWLVCSEICIPGETNLTLGLPAGTGAPDPGNAALFTAARARLPQPASFPVSFAAGTQAYRLQIPEAAVTGLTHAQAVFFPYDGNAIDQAAAQPVAANANGLTLSLAKPSTPDTPVARKLDGVLVLRGDGGAARAYAISAVPGPPPVAATAAAGAAASAPSPARAPAAPAAAVHWWEAVLLAFLGGLVLNLMPCVFPILSLKVLSLTGLAHRDDALRHGIAYAAGVVASFVVLGGTLLVLREGGAALGWGFQLQSPVVVALLAYLLLAMGLSLSGVVEFGSGLAGAGAGFAERGGAFGAFATGVLATVVATPCTAPFMGTALGFALIAPGPVALAVFASLGAGLAAPFLVAAAVPAARHRLPKPGAWMVVTRQVLAFPLYGSVAWLIWVLMQETAPSDALMVLFGLVAVAFAVWVYGRTRAGPRRLGSALAAAGIAVAIVLAARPTSPAPAAIARDGLPYEPFSSARLAMLTAEKKPVFVNLTASWCITCLFNERATLDSAAVRRAFAAHGVTALKGDWTRRNPDITAFLEAHGRDGVPLYLLYDKRGDATVLPQILTEREVLTAVGKI